MSLLAGLVLSAWRLLLLYFSKLNVCVKTASHRGAAGWQDFMASLIPAHCLPGILALKILVLEEYCPLFNEGFSL